ncbi:MAG: lipid-transfer protein [Acidobacteria bacterium]|nr:lipid-transfer protein [Acidobacteriota bacterium]
MRDVAIVAAGQRQQAAFTDETEVQILLPIFEQVRNDTGLEQSDIGFTCSGSSDFLAGSAFSFVGTLEGVGAYPPICESHVEMDGAWALYEAWVKLQIGEIDTALVYSYGKSSPGSLRDVLSTQLDPYYLAPLWPDAFALGALQARMMLEQDIVSRDRLTEIAVRSRDHASSSPHAVRKGDATTDFVEASPVIADPLRADDCAAGADGGCVIILAAGDIAKNVCDRPAWIRGIEHRTDAHSLAGRDLLSAQSAALAANAAGVGDDKIDIAELHGPFTHQEHLLETALGITDETIVNPSGGALAGHTMMAAGLMRIAEAATRVSAGAGDRAVAHATSGPWLQQNLVCVMEGD